MPSSTPSSGLTTWQIGRRYDAISVSPISQVAECTDDFLEVASRLIIAFGVVIHISSNCIIRQLYRISSGTITTTGEHWNTIIDLCLGIGIPILQMILCGLQFILCSHGTLIISQTQVISSKAPGSTSSKVLVAKPPSPAPLCLVNYLLARRHQLRLTGILSYVSYLSFPSRYQSDNLRSAHSQELVYTLPGLPAHN